MFDWFRKKEKNQETIPEVLGLRLGGVIDLDPLKLQLIENDLTIENAASTQLIQAVGEIQLGDNNRILRFYTDDDGFIQVIQYGTDELGIEEVKLVYYYDTLVINNQKEWENYLKHKLVKEVWNLDSQTFHKAWDNNSPVAMTETIWTIEKSKSQLDQFIMIYEREINDDLFETLFVIAEEKIESNQYHRCISISTAFDLSQTDFKTIG
ncbi:YjfK family protein [Aliivibrio fischeri]|uniref:YjfK family protein n=1 Tax=Aliivibrio fischeri TaxID=668 RepID=UPI0007C4EA7B|nr:YjfK family protein [Aliivibrio fischeri]MBP3140038.1 YjfK family protein [Aliivibrio fischeri]MBP3154419.1 YjfK family protein [Aliivibrio fischeri]MCE7572159.1 YjfK family protein [Aliivibrio fischeri]